MRSKLNVGRPRSAGDVSFSCSRRSAAADRNGTLTVELRDASVSAGTAAYFVSVAWRGLAIVCVCGWHDRRRDKDDAGWRVAVSDCGG